MSGLRPRIGLRPCRYEVSVLDVLRAVEGRNIDASRHTVHALAPRCADKFTGALVVTGLRSLPSAVWLVVL
jgi:hypothetical protein